MGRDTLRYDLPVNYEKLHWSERKKVREQYILEQKGKCHFCSGSLDFPPPADVKEKPLSLQLFPKGFLDYPIHLQHCHKTGMTEGAVHAYCNGVMWQYHGR